MEYARANKKIQRTGNSLVRFSEAVCPAADLSRSVYIYVTGIKFISTECGISRKEDLNEE